MSIGNNIVFCAVMAALVTIYKLSTGINDLRLQEDEPEMGNGMGKRISLLCARHGSMKVWCAWRKIVVCAEEKYGAPPKGVARIEKCCAGINVQSECHSVRPNDAAAEDPPQFPSF
ncbi:hypothetical protein K438DRAFT_1749826 [Mycena galopus ATCC 62051]|nr:hypothetical protein K438DRAFT_1749826 [Mycena galopus ATCC 62051]